VAGALGAAVLAATTALCGTAISTVDSASAAPGVRIISRIKTDKPVVFVTIDDGFRTEWSARWLLSQYRWPITNFVITGPLRKNARWFATLTPHVTFGTHTRTHHNLPSLDLKGQKKEICGGAEDVRRATGITPTWMRPPGGAYNADTVKAARSCGISAILLWRVRVNGNFVETWGGPIRPGDIILLHYRKDLAYSLAALKMKLDEAGLTPAPLDDYLDYPDPAGSTERP
jgi:peptidoglycan/xylan/chitin deacetylase (PgdA/CDA1 family)